MTEALLTAQKRIRLELRLGVVIGAFALAAVCLALYSTRFGGAGLTPDSINYITASKSLLAGQGYQRFAFNRAFTSWPPLYPTILAGLNLVCRALGLDIVEGIRLLHSLVFGASVALTGVLFSRIIRARLLVALALAGIVFAFPLLRDTVFVWSEIIYIFISLLFLLLLPRYLETGSWRDFLMLFALAVCGSLQRFAGIGLIPAGMLAILLLLKNTRLPRRLSYAILFGLSSIPYILWLVYGLTQPRASVSGQFQPLNSLLNNLNLTTGLLGEWFLPDTLRGAVPNLLVSGLVVLVVAWAFRRYFRLRDPLAGSPIVLAVYVIAYMAFYYLANSIINTTPVDHRHLSVMLIPLVGLLFTALDRLPVPAARRELVAAGIAVVGLLYPVARGVSEARSFAEYCCGAVEQRQSPLIQWLNAHPLQGRIYSNTPLPALYTPLLVYPAPAALQDWDQVPLSATTDTYVIWFNDPLRYSIHPDFYYAFNFTDTDLGAYAQVERVAETPDGDVYRLRAKANPN
jgi:hypothetical protein